MDGANVSIAVDPSMGDGRHEVRWSVISFDGASVQGVIPFVIGEAGADPDPLHAVISADGASLIRSVALAVFAVLLAWVAYGLVATYGRGATASSRAGAADAPRPRRTADRRASAPDPHG